MRAQTTPGLLLVSLRPEQWTKNLLVLAGVVFGGRLLEVSAVAIAAAAFAIFCALSGAVYLFNDIADRDADQNHPLKRERPIASGQLATTTAGAAGVILGAGGIAAAFAIGTQFGIIAATYVAALLLYSAALKHVVILDVLMIAAGFVLRAVAGAVAVDVPIGHWLLVCTTLLALFLALSKRRHELVLLADGATDHRRILEEYSPYLLDQMIGVVTSSTLIAYTVYATSPDTAARLGTGKLGLTIPFVLYGIFRYLYLVHQKRGGGSPAAMLLTDRPLLGCVALWAASVIALLYSPLGK
jgi:4-hydroxybenzoate polyprenyltransferase